MLKIFSSFIDHAFGGKVQSLDAILVLCAGQAYPVQSWVSPKEVPHPMGDIVKRGKRFENVKKLQ